MKLSLLLAEAAPDGVREIPVPGCSRPDPELSDLVCRSDAVTPGAAFVAVPGFRADGHDFIPDARRRGAAVVFAQHPVPDDPGPTVLLPDTRAALGWLAAAFFGRPSESLHLVAITGTNGKTTTSLFIESILSRAGLRSGVIGTIDVHYAGLHGHVRRPNPVTTPESLDLQRMLAEMRDDGVTHVVMEASSHALDLGRLNGCWPDVALFTNLTQDHLDWHGTMDRYWASKRRLFTDYLDRGPKRDRTRTVINTDDPKGRELAASMTVPCLTTGASPDNLIYSPVFDCHRDGIRADVTTPAGTLHLRSGLIGPHNLSNLMMAAGAALALGLPVGVIEAGLNAVGSIPGRLEPVRGEPGLPLPSVFVDYAHTPDALENVLRALRPVTGGRVVCVFGCGGDRDRSKRPLMGGIAGRLADVVVVTSDNPRTEEPLAIIRDILPGLELSGRRETTAREAGDADGFVVVPDRREAISLAVSLARSEDAVLIAGKGHETYQIVGRETRPFDDRAEARKALGTREV